MALAGWPPARCERNAKDRAGNLLLKGDTIYPIFSLFEE